MTNNELQIAQGTKHSPPPQAEFQATFPLSLLDPMRSDKPLVFVFNLTKRKPWLLAISYLIITLGGMILFASLKGVSAPNGATKTMELFEDYGNLLNIGFVVPLGIVLICNFYRRIEIGVERLILDGMLTFDNIDQRDKLLRELDQIINRPWFMPAALIASLSLNVYIALNLTNSWNEMSMGFPAYYFRLCALFNFYVIFHVLIKGVAAVKVIHRLLDEDIKLQPLHPDRCSGLLALGKISGALNILLALLTLYITSLVVIDGISLAHPGFLGAVALFFGLASYLFISPLMRSHRMMKQQRDTVLYAINAEFSSNFQRMAVELQPQDNADERPSISLEDIQRMDTLERLHQIAMRMPTWPINIQSFTKFFAVAGGPMVVAVLKVMLKSK